MNNWYIIDWELNIIPIGKHKDFDSADEAAQKIPTDVMYLAHPDSIKKLKEQLNSIEVWQFNT